MNKLSIAATLVACSLTLRAAAEHPAQRTPSDKALEERFKQLDKNGDGRITTDEMPLSPFFTQRDQNGDGAITLAEVKAVQAAGSTASEPAVTEVKTSAPVVSKAPRGHSTSSPLRQSPQPLKPAEHGVGRLVADIPFTDVAGKSHQLGSFSKQRAVVVALTSTSCPLSKKYLPTLTELAAAYTKRGVTWILVNPRATDKPEDMQAAAKSLAGKALYVHDRQGALARAVGALTTTDVIVLDGARTVVFHGAIDDQYGLGYAIEAPRHRYLADALDALLTNQQPPVPATDAPGCALDLGDPALAPVALTYHNRISRILQANCVECHREGGVGPFTLTSYDDAVAHAAMIEQVVAKGIMPPWFAAPAEDAQHEPHASPWANDRSLGSSDKNDLLAWIGGGKPQGDPRDAPRPPTFAEGWLIGKPDAIYQFPKAVAVKATGIMPYESVTIETNLAEDKWVQAIEIQPGDRSVVHHMLVFAQTAKRDHNTAADEVADERNGFWGIYVPGNATLIYPEGFAKRLPKGAKLRCQVHYLPSGTATTDRSQIGVVFAKKPPRHEVRVVGLINGQISIPAGASNHREEASLKVPGDVQLLSFLPHMHLRARACRYRAISSDGKHRVLLDIPRYDFNWQLLYRYYEPLLVAKGETIKFTVWYDNSDKNPANPDPNHTVRWGNQLTDEMHLGYVEYFVTGEKPGETPSADGGQQR